MQNLSYSRASEILNQKSEKKVAVIGDVMLDRFFWGSVSRVSPEAPVPVIDIERETFHLGGAANVANNLHSLGVKPYLCGLVGNDNSGNIFKEIASEYGINTDGIYIDHTRNTTVKTRIIGNNQHIARLDREHRHDISSLGEEFLLNFILQHKDLSAIIFEDYNKGVISNIVIREIISIAKNRSIPVFVDPKYNNFFNYKGVMLFKPNSNELRQALGKTIKSEDDYINAGKELLNILSSDYVLLTRGSAGMMLFDNNGEVLSIPTLARSVADVSGAGDTVIATLSAAYINGATMTEAAVLSNFAAGIVCELPGIVSINKDELIKSIKSVE